MSRILNVAGMAAVGMTAASMLLLAEPGFASDLAADAKLPAIILPGADAPAGEETGDLRAEAETPHEDSNEIEAEAEADSATTPAPVTAASLAELVAATPLPAGIDPDMPFTPPAAHLDSRGEYVCGSS